MAQTSVRARRALIVEPSGNLWGSERVLLDFLRVAVTSAWEIAVCCPPDTPILGALGELPIKVFETFGVNLHLRGRAQRLRATLGLLRAAREFRPDVLYVNQAGATRITLAVGRVLRLPVVTHVRLAEDVDYVSSLRATPKALPKVIAISRTIRALFPESGAVSQAQLEMIYDPYTCQSTDGEQAPNSPPQQPTWSCVGRLAHIKGQDLLLEAMSELRSQGIESRALFVGGPGPGDGFGRELEELARSLHLESHVVWMGLQRDGMSHLAQCTAQICPSRAEALGRVVFEAWDAGVLPVAYAGSGGPAEVIEQSGGGLLFTELTGASLAQTLREVLVLSPEKTGMIEAGRAWMRENCDSTQFTQKMLTLWDEVVSAR